MVPFGVVGPGLAAGQAVDLVVVAEDREVGVAADRVQQVVAADRRGVAVARDHDDVQLGADRLDRLGHRERAAVERVHGLEVHVCAHAAGAADAGDQDRVRLVQPEVVHDAGQLLHDQADAAAGAPDRREEIGLQLVLDSHLGETSISPGSAERGLWRRPPASSLGSSPMSVEALADGLEAHAAAEQRDAFDATEEHPLDHVGVLAVAALDDDDLLVAWARSRPVPCPGWARCGSGGRARSTARAAARSRRVMPKRDHERVRVLVPAVLVERVLLGHLAAIVAVLARTGG